MKKIKESKENRYLVNMEFFVWANSEDEARAQAEKFADSIDTKMDNRANVVSVQRKGYGFKNESKLKKSIKRIVEKKINNY